MLEVAKYWYIPALTIGCGVHRLFRRYVPRRSAPWTSLRLSELYISGGLGCSLAMKGVADIIRAYKDDDLAAVAVAGSHVSSASIRQSVLRCRDAVQDGQARQLACAIRSSSYTDSLRNKLLWWHYHRWVDKATYDAFATAIVHHSLQADPSWTPHHLTDFDICTTFIARCVSKRPRHISNSIWGAFAASIPIGIYMRRRAIYLPMNVVQRVLLGLIIYCDGAFAYHTLHPLQDIQDKHQVATAVTRIFGNMEKEIARTRATFAPLWFLL
ncbi:hypothetical protein OH76DRAFT_1025384 [Lentinus brumalis]|uniref:Uncharacterized protein n=1 Tax=Lentinus brumalis TaxID=2498619 RepID=A0A371CXN9_9APHY|nr:hypothetical protein OH76DRAFT_1025384 [Polyporus brumalis]